MLVVETLEKWSEVSESLSRMGYIMYQMQYGVNDPEGFHARFFLASAPLFEVVTFNLKVHDAIVQYGSER